MSNVAKRATKRDLARRPAFFYRSAREGMLDFLDNLPGMELQGVLLPSFIGWSPREGSGVFDPIKSVGVRAGFYGLDEDLSPDLNEITDLARTGNYRVLVVIHYFGRAATQMDKIRQIADDHGMLLVEDLAHAFFTAVIGRSAGNYGDMNLFSLHKMFPLPVGGMTTYRRQSLVHKQESSMPELAAEVMSYDWEDISRRRRENFAGLSSRLNALPGVDTQFRLLWPDLNEHDVPQTLPVYVSGAKRDALYASMNERGYGMVSLYHTLIEEVRIAHSPLEKLARHIINFPCHQDVVVDDLDGLVEAFQIGLNKS